MTTQAQIDANAANAKLATGPRSAFGKRVSRMNGLKHGMRAKTLILPGEDPREFEEQVQRLNKIVKPRDDMEVFLIHEYVARAWRTQRVRLAYDLRLLTAIDEADSREEDEAAQLGRQLMHDRGGPMPVYGAREYYHGDRTSYTSEEDKDPTPAPADLVKKLEATQAGCKWLLERWGELRARIQPGKFWESSDKFKAIRLMGHQPLEAIDVKDVAYVFLGSFAINPVNKHAFMELHGELSDEEMEKFLESVKRQFGPTINPGDSESGRKLLTLIVNEEVERLEAIALEHEENREVYVEERTARLRDDDTPDGERFKRYDLASSRVLGRGLEAVWKHRRNVLQAMDDEVEFINHTDVGKRFMMGDGSGTEILICSDGLARPDIKLDLTKLREDAARANEERRREAERAEEGEVRAKDGGRRTEERPDRAEDGILATAEMVDPSELVSEGFAHPGLGGEKDEKPRNLTTEANFSSGACASETHLQSRVTEKIETPEALDNELGSGQLAVGSWSAAGESGARPAQLVGARGNLADVGDSSSMIDTNAAIGEPSDSGGVMGVT